MARLALHPNVSAQAVDEALHNGEAEAAEASRHQTVAPGKFLEKFFLASGIHADVAQAEADDRAFGIGAQRRHGDFNLAPRGKLDRVAREIKQDLLQPHGVAQHVSGQIGRERRDEFEPLLRRARAQEGDDIRDRPRQGNRADSKSSLPLSIFEKSRMSFDNRSRVAAELDATSTWPCRTGLS